MDLDDLEFGAIGLLFAISGTVGLILTLHGISAGMDGAAALAVPSIGLVAVGRALDPARRWSLRLAQPACVAAAAIWALAGGAVAATPEILVYSVALIAACRLAWSFLDTQLRGPDWARSSEEVGAVVPGTGGWIEELPDARLPIRALRRPAS